MVVISAPSGRKFVMRRPGVHGTAGAAGKTGHVSASGGLTGGKYLVRGAFPGSMTTWSPLEMEFTIRRTPAAVRAWWTDLPDDYRATDPKEQPFRIVTREKHADGRLVETHWKTPAGTMKSLERLILHADGSWSFEVPKAPFGVKVRDDFRAVATKDGTTLHVTSMFWPQSVAHRLLAFAILPILKKMFRGNFAEAARICERDAPEQASAGTDAPATLRPEQAPGL